MAYESWRRKAALAASALAYGNEIAAASAALPKAQRILAAKSKA